MNKHPLNPITPEHREDYARDGVTCLRGMFDQSWIAKMRAAADALTANPDAAPMHGPSHSEEFVSALFMWRKEGAFRDFILDSPLAEVVAKTIGSKEIRAYQDHLFIKHVGSPHIMPWHHDMTTWPFDGEQVPTIWVALSNVTESNGRLEFVKGYQKKLMAEDIIYSGHYPGGDFGPQNAVKCPNFWDLEGKNGVEIISWDLEPGDAVIFHPRIPHGSKHAINASEPRIGLSSRWIGDDIVWNFREGNVKIPDVDDMPKGKPVRGEVFPLVWSETQNTKSQAA